MLFSRAKTHLPEPDKTLAGRSARPFTVPERHVVLGTPLEGPVPDGFQVAYFGMGCFWGAERRFWQVPGVWSTAVGYQGGGTSHPVYEEVCTGMTGHDEVVRVVYDPQQVSFADLLTVFWETHDPTQGYRQGNDVGTQYRSAVVLDDRRAARRDRGLAGHATRRRSTRAGLGEITTEVQPAPDFYYAEELPPAVPGEGPPRLRLPRHHRGAVPRLTSCTNVRNSGPPPRIVHAGPQECAEFQAEGRNSAHLFTPETRVGTGPARSPSWRGSRAGLGG